jgi:hypothetical protein
MRHKFVMLGLLAALLLALAAPSGARRTSAAAPAAPVGTSAQTHAAFLDKTRFLAHAGIVFFIIATSKGTSVPAPRAGRATSSWQPLRS